MKTIAYVGCRTTRERNARGRGLKVYEIDRKSHSWKELQLISELQNPSYMCMDNMENYLYIVHGDGYSVSAFKINTENGTLTFINNIDSVGRNPVFITVDKANQYIYVACLQGGAVYTLKRNSDGSITEPIHIAKLPGKIETGFSHAHQCLWDQAKEFLFVPTQSRGVGYSQVNVFKALADGSLQLTHSHNTRELDEARHVAVHGNNRYVYGLNEKDNSVVYYSFDSEFGELSPKQKLSTLPDYYRGESQASAVLIHPTNRFLFTSNRIHDSISLFSVNPHTGYMKFLRNTSCMGKTPRFMTFSPDGSQLVVANEDSDTIRIFNIRLMKGELVYSGQTIRTESPVSIVFKQIRVE